jgi:lipopolysaccharide transport system permease protein
VAFASPSVRRSAIKGTHTVTQNLTTSQLRSTAGLSPVGMIVSFVRQRVLIGQIAKRDVVSRYRGAYLGVVWSLITPLMMLAVYTFVFSTIFKSRWGTSADQSKLDFALTLFCGLLVYNVFAETISRAPTLVTGNPSYVKKVRFPLEALPVAALFTALVNGAASLAILLVAWVVVHHTVSSTIWLFPVALLPLCLLALGLAWFISALGVFIRDIAHPVGVLVQMLMFISGIFFPLAQLPPTYQRLLKMNPLVTMLENVRRTLIWGQQPNWKWWAIATAGSFVVMQLGYYWFMRSRKAFADVI